MRQSQLLIPTTKEKPADADVVSHQLMLRAGLIRQIAAGLYAWLPLGLRVVRRIERIVREELDRAGAQEVSMPVVQPAELWEESGRWTKMGPEMLRMTDRHDRDYCLGPTHEEVITELFRREVHSYRQLPCNFYQIQTKFRDEIRPRFGVMRAREFTMKDGYSFHADQDSFDTTYKAMYDCYARILARMDLEFRAVEADTGNIGGANSHEFHVLAEAGEDTIVYASDGSYAANLERAEAAPPDSRPEPSQTITKVPTPGQKTIRDIARFLDVAPEQCVKTLLVAGDSGPVAIVLRGDHDLNAVKAEKLPGVCAPLAFVDDDAVRRATGADVGSIGPVNLDVPLLIDREAYAIANFVCGANETDQHFTGVNWHRDVAVEHTQIVDCRNVVPGDPAPHGQGELRFLKGIEVGHIFQLGDVYSKPMGATVLDADGKTITPIMGCYGMGITRLVAAIIEQNHDEVGIIWPRPVAPFHVHIVALNYSKSEKVRDAADTLHQSLNQKGIDVLLDDRAERPGVKFADADLLGMPHRITIGERTLKQGCVEYRPRGADEDQTIPIAEIGSLVGE